jgi:hypothetical protein
MGNWSAVKINNAALGLVGCRQIVSLDEGSTESAQCSVYWPLTLEYVLERHPWKCVGKQATLTTTTTAPQFGYSYAYPLPADFVRMISMDDGDDKFHAAGKVLHCDDSPAYIWYVPLEMDATKYDAMLAWALVLHQAYCLAFALRGDDDKAQLIFGHLEKFFYPIILHADASRRGVRELSSNVLTDVFRL